ncbi:platelet-activating factor receptor isoform X2 [Callorhinchus milii]|uniref:Platelet-activating factor receptor n=2 Tax=Callorhinchus milii TaxID=7868 RepID=A0A4W3J9L1_CALMI|nr:platelet-activating factor receptor isoform X2 [Callorhinchus milii]XP_007892968.1 platelet-activating factor receptor isoform X2 [Callorhinchus milii]XP_007892970.1 platelet-activating factor receptor isoform X2 [Callorhinchus milii]XP_007892971.1 platelet-activating factor receptor isoform X2 [Callorhinchus milii]XP_042194773.1 platelet-activating factor receptor isoform X2 [Callorhinchus milii]|eukprot:gi/632954445/ref/XP_007892967.1/ PREDICTED: platelet-activating factor receptor [Callorhinchus milii]
MDAMYSPSNVSLSNSSERKSNCTVDTEFRYILFPVVYSIIFLLGLMGNCYVLWVFKHLSMSRNINEVKIFMVNLSIADLLFILTLPFWIVYYCGLGNWVFPEFFCRMVGCLFFINTYCSIAFLAAISYNRYCAVARPIESIQQSGRKRGMIVSFAIWFIILCSASPFLFMKSTNQVGTQTHCFEGYDKDSSMAVMISNFVLITAFFFAFLVIVVCNLHILRLLSTQTIQPGNTNHSVKQQAFRMVCAVMVVFSLCFLPHHVVQGPWTLTVLEQWRVDDCQFRQAVNDAHQVTLCLMSLNCALDPIIYCFLTKKFRRFLTKRLSTWRTSRKSFTVTTNNEGDMIFQGLNPTGTLQH